MEFQEGETHPLKALNILYTMYRVGVLHHVFRNDIQIDFFDTSWFLLVTMSTVGYGDISPEAWLGKLLVVLVIVTAIIYIIPKLEELYQAFQIQQKLHNSVSVKQSRGKFVLICSTHLEPLVLRDFLTEFYSDPNHYVSSVCFVQCVCVYMYSDLLLKMMNPSFAQRGPCVAT